MNFSQKIKLFHLLQSTLANGFQHSVLYVPVCVGVHVCVCVCLPGGNPAGDGDNRFPFLHM